MGVIIRLEPFDEHAALAEFAGARAAGAGALASFVGYCRGHSSEGAVVVSLHLDHYPGFTELEIERLAAAVMARHDLLDLMVMHRAGVVTAGEAIVLVAAMSAHRSAAFAAVATLMDYLKTDAPFWKREITGGQSRWIEPNEADRARRKALGD